jgi:hypothetical protein
LIIASEVSSKVITRIPVPKNRAKAKEKNPEDPKEAKPPL